MSLRYNIKNNIDTKTCISFKPIENNNLDDIKVLIVYIIINNLYVYYYTLGVSLRSKSKMRQKIFM